MTAILHAYRIRKRAHKKLQFNKMMCRVHKNSYNNLMIIVTNADLKIHKSLYDKAFIIRKLHKYEGNNYKTSFKNSSPV